MAAALSTPAQEGSTYIVDAAFTDEDGDAVVPATVVWTLSTPAGDVVNSREDVSETPASTVNIVLSGDDLATTDGLARLLTVEATYDSDLGLGLPIKDQVTFHLEDLTIV